MSTDVSRVGADQSTAGLNNYVTSVDTPDKDNVPPPATATEEPEKICTASDVYSPLDPRSALASRSLLDPSNNFLSLLAFNDPGGTGVTGPATVTTVAVTTSGPRISAKQQALLSLDLASEKLSKGDGAGAADVLSAAANNARNEAAKLNPTSPDAKFLIAFADNVAARAAAYTEQAPLKVQDKAFGLNRVSGETDTLAAEFESKGLTKDAKLLRAIAADSHVQASVLAQSAQNTNVLLGQGLSQTYQQIVNASFDKKINDARGWAYPWESQSPRAKLVADKQKMQVVFTELNRTMEESGTSLDRAWNMMFDDNRIDGWKSDKRVPGFATRNDAATFLRDNEVTKDLLSPFADMARGLSEGNLTTVETAQVGLVKALRDNGQWQIARAVLDAHLKAAKTPEGIQGGQQLDGNETREWLKAKASEFVLNDLPVLVLSGLVSGGLGTGARALALAATWGTRAARGVQLAVEIGSFVPTERILNEAINGRRADWSAGSLARDYAFTIGGMALFKGLGKGWQAIRESGFAKDVAGKFKFGGETVELITPDGVRLKMKAKEFEALVTKPLGSAGANSASGALSKLSADELNAVQRIAQFRQLKSLPTLDLTPKTGGPSGTVAYVKEGGKEIYGLNTTLERDLLHVDTATIRNGVLKDIQTKLGKLQGATLGGRAQFLTHAEAEALINAQRELGKLPEKLTLYVDRPTCNMCSGGPENGLPLLAELYGVKELTVIDSLGNRLLVRPGQPTIRVK